MPKGPEAGFQDAVVQYAQMRGWRVAHFRRATVRAGRVATPVAYDAAGFPDLVLVRKGVLIFAELKSKGIRKVSVAQKMWQAELQQVAALNKTVLYYVWNPLDWDDIEEILK